ncbi:Erythromycin esterase [Clostridium perfringens]|uniref:erythromycin esterase family protein n=1 Tax=Clostridium perfringens TaxID=1502 RepID=UPI0024437CAC|nr:erythromycin esterase family protein [Clostridium perfringens]MDG6880346.1 Erythromycin esterase [Clostridium perfringens]
MKKRIKHSKIWYIVFGLLVAIALVAFIFMHFGGFSTGENANPEEFAKYAQSVEDITIPENAKIIALGEATHGNVEFQQLKLDVFKKMVEDYGVRALVLEGDYGGCEQVNRYIHGGEGTTQESAEAIGFTIYRTDEMAELISYMKQYNESADEGEELRFYGFDMQRISYSFQFLNEVCKELGIDTTSLQKLMDGEKWSSEYNYINRKEIITQVKNELKSKQDSSKAIHFADMLLQYCELQNITETDGSTLRDRFMAENVQWILQQEKQRGKERIFVTGHNSHVAKWGSFDSMGKLLSSNADNGYYVIGTDFYRTHCNMPTSSSTRRTNQVFYSHNPLAKTAKMAGLDICWLDFANIPKDSELAELISQYIYMGNLGESYSWFMRLLPPSYRIFQPPAVLYDSMIFVTDANPTKIITEK